ncbi:zf-HC2 domain-containing protein [Staphylococcus chromogenes]|nr:zf-HC2 domain-containing protein [Staphylococcus chromogenes]
MNAMPSGSSRPHLPNLSNLPNIARLQKLIADRDRSDEGFDSIEHLSAEAIAGYVDNELPPVAMSRARVHLVHCAECRAEVQAQRRAAERLRQSAEEDITVPSSLLDRLNLIEKCCPEGPEVDDLPAQRAENFVARLETFYRAVKKARGQ